MKKKIIVIGYILVLSTIVFGYTSVSATSGKLRSSSIITCNGVMYGSHGDGHWHKAVRHKSGYYPDGSPVNPPCLKTNSGTTNNSSNSSSKKNNSSTKEEKANLNIKSIIIDNDNLINIENSMNYITYNKDINLKVITEDTNAAIKIDGNLNDLEINKVRIIKIVITHLNKSKTYTLNVIRKVNLEMEKISLNLNDQNIILDNENILATVNNKEISFSSENIEGVSVKIYKDSQEISTDMIDDDATYEIKVGTLDNQIKTYYLNVKYIETPSNIVSSEKQDNNNISDEEKNNNTNIVPGAITITGLSGLGYYLLKKRNTK